MSPQPPERNQGDKPSARLEVQGVTGNRLIGASPGMGRDLRPHMPGSWSLTPWASSLQEGLMGKDGGCPGTSEQDGSEPDAAQEGAMPVGLSCATSLRLQPGGSSPCSQALGG